MTGAALEGGVAEIADGAELVNIADVTDVADVTVPALVADPVAELATLADTLGVYTLAVGQGVPFFLAFFHAKNPFTAYCVASPSYSLGYT